MKNTDQKRATLKSCSCTRCNASFTIMSTDGWRPKTPLCEECDYGDFLDEVEEFEAEAKRRERLYS